MNSYNAYITSGGTFNEPLNGFVNALSSALTQNQKNIDAALARAINAQFNTVSYNSLTGTPLYTGNQQVINQLINAISPNAAAYQDVLNQLSPGIYTTLPTILFNSANLQNIQLQQRLGVLRTSNTDAAPENELATKKVVVPSKNPCPSSEPVTS